MKIITILIVLLSLVSCHKKDTINHFLTKPITQQELENNGFYKYSYITTLDEQNKVYDTMKSTKYDMYSNVKPERNKEGKLCPTQLWNFYSEDSIRKRKNTDYFKNELKSKVITYVFRDEVLFYKEINIYYFDENQNKTPGFTNTNEIIKYYRNLKIPIEPIIKNNISGERFTDRFMVNNYRTRFYFSKIDKQYGIFVNYLNQIMYYNTYELWYSGQIINMHYYD